MQKAILNTLHDIPEAKPGARRISILVKARGRIVGYQLSDGSVVSKQEGVRLAKEGEIAGVGVGIRHGTEYLKSMPDAHEGNNLTSLPSMPVPRG
ncbi:MAG: DUF3892 domain-containing protein [Clostridia bacterium]